MSRFIIVFALLALIQVSCAKRVVNLEDLMVRNVREVEASGEGSGELSSVEASGEESEEVEASGEGSGEESEVEASGEGSGEETVEASGEGSGAEEGSGTVVEPLILTDPVPETLNTPILTETI